MDIIAVYTAPNPLTALPEEWTELHTQFTSIEKARKSLKRRRNCKLIWVEETNQAKHTWEKLDEKTYQCSVCGLFGAVEGNCIRPTKRAHILSDLLLCDSTHLLKNLSESAKWVTQIRKEGFR